MTAEFWFNEYRMPDGSRRVMLAGFSRAVAVWVGGHVQGLIGALVVLRWRVVARMPAVFERRI
ncbi:hypothetical protein [Methylobacterium sp.]|uniref:hypothetical protein n=1 Tax=Methylobacterium sp. TaxID=409 RepID=UPI000C4CA1AA|nr:hypothetical protein [Methylobacterium sp.]MBP27858.1 hypothetical protein [Methylobacterium sp.]